MHLGLFIVRGDTVPFVENVSQQERPPQVESTSPEEKSVKAACDLILFSVGKGMGTDPAKAEFDRVTSLSAVERGTLSPSASWDLSILESHSPLSPLSTQK